MNGSKTFSKIDIGETIVLRGSKFPFNFEYWKYVLNPRVERHRSLSKDIGVVLHKLSHIFKIFENISDDYMISDLVMY